MRLDPECKDLYSFYQGLDDLAARHLDANPETAFEVEWEDDGALKRLAVVPAASATVLHASLPVTAADGAYLKGRAQGVVLLFTCLSVRFNFCFASCVCIVMSWYAGCAV